MNDSVAIVGHEVRNLIATFVGFTELLLSNDWPPEQQREYLETMRDEALRAEQFLQDLLDLERIEAGELSLKPRATDFAALLHYAAAIAAHDPVHPIVLDCPTDLPFALAEPDRVQQVLANLLSNARKYTPKGGPIQLSARIVRNMLEVSVMDRGVGIPSTAMPHMFEKFFRVESPGHQGIRGTGLGLAVCRRIIDAHGGRIWAESAGAGLGTSVSFTLPLAGAKRGAAATALPRPRLSSRGGHVATYKGDARYPRLAPTSCRSTPSECMK